MRNFTNDVTNDPAKATISTMKQAMTLEKNKRLNNATHLVNQRIGKTCNNLFQSKDSGGFSVDKFMEIQHKRIYSNPFKFSVALER